MVKPRGPWHADTPVPPRRGPAPNPMDLPPKPGARPPSQRYVKARRDQEKAVNLISEAAANGASSSRARGTPLVIRARALRLRRVLGIAAV